MILMRGAMLVRMAKECVSKTEASRDSWPARERRRKRQKTKKKEKKRKKKKTKWKPAMELWMHRAGVDEEQKAKTGDGGLTYQGQ